MATRRERVRAETAAQIKDVARRHLVTGGPGAVSLRAIARDVGMTAPGLYRYFPSLDDLVRTLVGDLYDELDACLARARDALPAEAAGERAIAVCRAFRAWSVAHPAEFGLLFGSPPLSGDTGALGRQRLGGIFATLFADLWTRYRFPVPAGLDPGLAAQLDAWRASTGTAAPTGAIGVLLGGWVRVYGLVALEVFGHLRFVLPDPEPLFEETLREFAELLGIGEAYRRP
ncbi:MAG TPA: TetR/AcrR family transcriptional regulator [Mycobacteriales bacterium]